jgi:cell division protein WhiA
MNEKCCLLSELAAVVGISGSARNLEHGSADIRIVTENAAFARKLFSTVRKLFRVNPEVTIRKSRKFKKHVSYILVITSSIGMYPILDNMVGILQEAEREPAIEMGQEFIGLLKRNCCQKAFLRGAFLAGGSISDPEKTYHLEITTHSARLAENLKELVGSFELKARCIRRKGNHVVYLKEGENIVDFLNIIGAHSALMELENVRILKEMRNNVNRIVNCETANLDKTVNASLRQIENIQYIRDHIGFENLPESLSTIAELRLVYSEANLKELGEMLNPPLGKSGVNHRLRKLDEIAEDMRDRKGEL